MSPVRAARELRRAVVASVASLVRNREGLDRANVYPVPDGDTGTNLVLTMRSAAAALEGVPDEAPALAEALQRGSLMGARGNSGVILAQIMRGICERIGPAGLTGEALSEGIAQGVRLAYEAVLEPVEGTILTVARAAAEAADGAVAESGGDALAVLEAGSRAARDALARTPDLLPVLRAAGVVDAGGWGLTLVLEAWRDALAGRAEETTLAGIDLPPSAAPTGEPLGYEVQYLLEAPDEAIAALRERLGAVGNSIAVIGGSGRWKVHIHTDNIGRAIEIGLALGHPSDVTVVPLVDVLGCAVPSSGEGGIPLARAGTRVALVAVASGAGARRLFAELGASVQVEGGATMNPSVRDFVTAIAAAPAPEVIVLPNNENAFGAAAQAAALSGKRVEVVPSRDMTHGLAAALAFGDARTTESNVAEMSEALQRARSGAVAVAVRDAATPAGPVRKGQAIGFVGGEAVAITADPVEACVEVAVRLGSGAVTLTVLVGAGPDEAERARLEPALRDRLAGSEIEILDGGQPVHRYLLCAE